MKIEAPLFLLSIILLNSEPSLGIGYELYDSDDFYSTLPQLKDWCYQNKACREPTWSSLIQSSACKNSTHPPFQSPINLPGNISKLFRHKRTKETHFLNKEGYVFESFEITNTGRTLLVRPNFEWESSSERGKHGPQTEPAHTVTIDNQTYFFHSLHFHWGSGDDIGSEHTIQGKSYPVEVHLVYYSWEYRHIKYPLMQWTNEHGLVVIAILLDMDMDDSEKELHSYCNALFPIVGSFEHLKSRWNKTITSPLILRDLFQGERQLAYKYQGSMTTPPCRENVLWYVIRRPVIVPKWHIRAFRETEFFGSGKYANNFR